MSLSASTCIQRWSFRVHTFICLHRHKFQRLVVLAALAIEVSLLRHHRHHPHRQLYSRILLCPQCPLHHLKQAFIIITSQSQTNLEQILASPATSTEHHPQTLNNSLSVLYVSKNSPSDPVPHAHHPHQLSKHAETSRQGLVLGCSKPSRVPRSTSSSIQRIHSANGLSAKTNPPPDSEGRRTSKSYSYLRWEVLVFEPDGLCYRYAIRWSD